MEHYLLKQYKIIGPTDRLIISNKASTNNFLANTNSGKIIIKDYVFFGKNVCMITGTHDYTKINEERMCSYPKEGNDIIINEGAWIGTNAIIIGPCTIGRNAVIGAGSVVIKDVNENCIVAGNPAKKIKSIVL